MIFGLLAGMALAVSPAHATLTVPAAKTLDLRNTGAVTIAVGVRRRSAPWLQIRPSLVVLRPGSHRLLTVRARADTRARAGDHEFVVLLLAKPAGVKGIAVRMRVGVRLRVRVPGRLVRRIVLHGLRTRRTHTGHVLLVSLANAGNVTEPLHGRLSVTLVRRGRLVSRLRYVGTRELFPDTRSVVPLPYAGRARGVVNAVVSVGSARRRYRLRL